MLRVPKDTYYDIQQEAADLDQEKAAKEKPGTGMCTHTKYLHAPIHKHMITHTSTHTNLVAYSVHC